MTDRTLMFDQEAGDPPPDAGLRPGTISALVEDLVRRPEGEPGAPRGEPLAPGTVIGRFELVREVGRGGFGVVYEARDRELGRLVAFKAINPGKHQQLREERLLREAEAAARLSHPNIVTLYDLGRSDRGPYLVMELLRGWPLRRRMQQGPLPVLETLRVGIEMAKGLAHAHAQGVIHRDLKPANVFLCEDGQVKVLDLGLAHAFGHRKLDGGTPGYMAPEQRRGAPEDERTDVFALGVILFEMMVGELPFREDGTLSRSAPDLEIGEQPALGALVHRMLATDPVSRPRDAAEVLQALTVFRRELERSTPAGVPRPVVHTAPRRRGEREVPDRTSLCSVVYVDIVDHAEQSPEIKAEWKAALDERLAAAMQSVPESERLVVDGGSGAAVCFLGDPGGAVSCALALLRAPRAAEAGNLRLRAGIHLGPVKVMHGQDGNLNAIGDGVNVAQLVATCGADGQVLASRSFFEIASGLSERYKALFAPGEIRRDEHAHEHTVHELRPHRSGGADSSGSGSGGRPGLLDPAVVARIGSRAAAILGPIAYHLARTATPRVSTPLELGRVLAAYIPSSEDRDAFLRACDVESASSPASTPAPIPTPTPTGGPETPIPPFDPALLERVARALAHHIGPVATVLVSRAARRARSEAELRDILAAEIKAPADRAAFLRTLQRG